MTNFTQQQKQNDPEFTSLFDYFAFEDVASKGKLDDKTKYMSILATLLGCQGEDEFKVMLPIALKHDVTPVEVKEIVYQATAYLGIGRTMPFLTATNGILEQMNMELPLDRQGTTTKENRREVGTAKQVELFGEAMEEFWKASDINYLLAANCFGDYYTRGGLDNAQRELVTFCYIAAQGGCEPQLAAHTAANIKQGNEESMLFDVVLQMVPYIGYPRSLNAIAVIKQVAKELAKEV